MPLYTYPYVYNNRLELLNRPWLSLGSKIGSLYLRKVFEFFFFFIVVIGIGINPFFLFPSKEDRLGDKVEDIVDIAYPTLNCNDLGPSSREL